MNKKFSGVQHSSQIGKPDVKYTYQHLREGNEQANYLENTITNQSHASQTITDPIKGRFSDNNNNNRGKDDLKRQIACV